MSRKWEYAFIQERGDKIQDELDSWGKAGWEAVGFQYVDKYTVLMKREVIENNDNKAIVQEEKRQ